MKKYSLGIFFLIIIPFAVWLLLVNSEQELDQAEIAMPPEEKSEIKLYSHSDQIKPGETLEQILLKNDIPRTDAVTVIQSFQQVHNVRNIKAGQDYCLLTDSLGQLHRFEYQPDLVTVIEVQRDSEDQFFSSKRQISLIEKIQSTRGTVKTTLYEAILERNEKPELIAMFSDIFQWDIDFFTDPRVGDEFRIVFTASFLPDSTKPDSVGQFVRYERILIGQYCLGDKPMIALYFDNAPSKPGYYDLEGRSFQKTFLKSPLNYSRISSHFSFARRHPILKIIRPHFGVDFAAPAGTPVVASADGIVIQMGYDRGIGNYVKIQHKNPHFVTLYGHLSKFARGVCEGIQIKQKDLVGYVGSTGLATGPHLHYTFYENGRPINPLKIKNTSGDPILPQNLAAFDSVKTEMLTLLHWIESGGRHPLFATGYGIPLPPMVQLLPAR